MISTYKERNPFAQPGAIGPLGCLHITFDLNSIVLVDIAG